MTNRRIVEAREAVCADPENDGLRNALADAYEAGEETERARFIRLQVQRASLPEWDSHAVDLELEERALLAKHESHWRKAELPKLEGVTWGRFERGMVARAGFRRPADITKHGAAVVAATPITRAVMHWPDSNRFPTIPALGQIRELSVVGAVYSSKDLIGLGKCPLLDSVRELNLVDAELRTSLAGLLKSSRLANLEALRIPHHQLGNQGMKAVLNASLPALKELMVQCAEHYQHVGSGEQRLLAAFTEKVVYALTLWPGLRQLEALDISGNLVGIDALRGLLGSPSTARLRRLRIRRVSDAQWDMDDSLEALGFGPRGQLDELDVGDNDLNQSSARALAEGSAMQSLKVLRMDRVRSKSFDVLSSARWMHEVLVLHADAKALPSVLARAPRKLHTLIVDALPEDGVIAALSTRPLPGLKVLDMSRASLDDAGLRQLGTLDIFPGLVELRLRIDRPRFTEVGALQLASSPLGQQLISLTTGFAAADRLSQPIPETIGHGAYRGPLGEL